jgi:threonine dehydratase
MSVETNKEKLDLEFDRLVNLDDINSSRKIIFSTNLIRRTPMLKDCENFSDTIIDINKNLASKFSLNFKLENMQNQGSYKIRGIMNRVNKIDPSKKLVTMSAGNFGRSFAFASSLLKYDSTIIMPDTAPIDRIEVCRNFGCNVELAERDFITDKVQSFIENNYEFIHPFDHFDIISAVGSVGLEILEDMEDVDLIIVGIGGGSLISGIATAVKLSGSKAKIIGVEPEGAAKMYISLQKNEPHKLEKITSFVNGLSAPYAGKITFKHVKEYVDEVVLVKDESVKKAMKLLYNDYKIVTCSAGAACLASILENKIDICGKKVVCVISGGNCTAKEMSTIIE